MDCVDVSALKGIRRQTEACKTNADYTPHKYSSGLANRRFKPFQPFEIVHLRVTSFSSPLFHWLKLWFLLICLSFRKIHWIFRSLYSNKKSKRKCFKEDMQLRYYVRFEKIEERHDVCFEMSGKQMVRHLFAIHFEEDYKWCVLCSFHTNHPNHQRLIISKPNPAPNTQNRF